RGCDMNPAMFQRRPDHVAGIGIVVHGKYLETRNFRWTLHRNLAPPRLWVHPFWGHFTTDWHQWKSQTESGPLAFAFAGYRDRSAVEFHNGLGDRKPHSQSTVGSGRNGLALSETVEDIREKFGLQPAARIRDADLDVRIDALQNDLDTSSLRSELDGIRQQVPHHLLKPLEVAGNRSGVRIQNGLNSNLPRLRCETQR